ncbi:MAG: DUF938 domain-containing protein [Candidatus Binatia bacterium]
MQDPADDRRRHAPATLRNRDPILSVLGRVLPAAGKVVEIASGSGEHAVHFAAALPGLQWQPTDHDAAAVESIAAWREREGPANLLPPILLDVRDEDWGVGVVDAVFCANMIHIAPWTACLGLLSGAGRHLRSDGLLVLYGPFRIEGRPTAPSNEAFDRQLRASDPTWGIRNLTDVLREAARAGLVLEETVPMPANNQTVVLRKP